MGGPTKGRSDYLKLGDWNVACSMCGRKRKASEMVRNWQGMWRCPEHNEPRHPQDFVRGVPDRQDVPFSQPETDLNIQICTLDGISAVPGLGIPGCMIPSKTTIGPGGSTPVTTGFIWTNRGLIIPGVIQATLAARSGRAILINSLGATFQSVNGGKTWAGSTAIPGPAVGFGNLAFGNGVWIYGGNASTVARSTDNGTTWTAIATGVASGFGGFVATDGAGTWIVSSSTIDPSDPNLYAISHDNGVTWSLPGLTNGVGTNFGNPIWDGSKFIIVGEDGNTGHTTILTSPSGTVWSSVTAAILQTGIVFAGTHYAAGGTLAPDIGACASPTAAGVGSAPLNKLAILDASAGISLIATDGQNFFLFDGAGAVVDTQIPAGAWRLDTFPSAGSPGIAACYDPGNKAMIAITSFGYVLTLP